MSHEIETMAWVGEKPWHGLGNEMPAGATPRQMMVAAGLDWKVVKAPLTAQVNGKQVVVPDYFALVRDSDDFTLSTCGNGYVPLQNEKIFEFFARYCEAGRMQMETAGSLRNGRHVWALAKLDDGFTLPGGDEVAGYLLFSQPHEYGQAWTIKFVPIRVVCQNTITLALRSGDDDGTFRRAHVSAFDGAMLESVEQTLGLANDMLNDFEAKSRLLAATTYEAYDVTHYVAELFQSELLKGEKLLGEGQKIKVEPQQFKRNAGLVYEAIERSPGATMESAAGTWWGAVNAATYVVDHQLGRDRDAAVHKAWFGDNAALKRRALDLAVAYAEAAQ